MTSLFHLVSKFLTLHKCHPSHSSCYTLLCFIDTSNKHYSIHKYSNEQFFQMNLHIIWSNISGTRCHCHPRKTKMRLRRKYNKTFNLADSVFIIGLFKQRYWDGVYMAPVAVNIRSYSEPSSNWCVLPVPKPTTILRWDNFPISNINPRVLQKL